MVPGDTSVLGRVGKGQFPRGTTSTARLCEGRLVAQVELSPRLHCSSVFCAVPRRWLGTRRERPHTIGERCVVGHAPHVSASFASLDCVTSLHSSSHKKNVGLEPYLPASEGCWRRELVKGEIRNLQSLVCSIIL